MASGIYHSFFERLGRGAGDLQSVTVKVALVTSSYTFDADHDYFNDVTNEVSGTGYSSGGGTVTVTVTDDDTNNWVTYDLGGYTWTTATLTARGAVYYVDTAGASSTDWLICYIDFGSNQSVTAANFVLTGSTIRLTP